MDAQDQRGSVRRGSRLVRRPSPASLVSVAAHVVLLIAVWHAIQVPAVFDQFLQTDRRAKLVPEKITYVTVAPAAPAPAAPTRANPRAVRRATTPEVTTPAVDVVPLVAPTEIPTELPAPAPAAPIPDPVTGPLRGGTGPARGVQPNYDDARVWTEAPEFIYAPKTDKERLDSALLTTLMRHADSVAANAYSPNKFERGDWTFDRNGQKWGVDQQYIRLGRFSIPTALLALLPLNRMQANPIQMERDRTAAWQRADILYHAQAAMNEEQFRQAVRQIRDRKERERRTAQRVSPTSPGPITSPGERPPPR